MKTFIALALLLVAVNALDKEIAQEIRNKLRAEVEECSKEVSASAGDVSEIFAHKMPQTHEGKCIFFCMHKKHHTQNDDGTLNLPGALEHLEILKELDADLHTKISSIFKTCASTPFDADPCVFGANLVSCYVKERISIGLNEDFEME